MISLLYYVVSFGTVFFPPRKLGCVSQFMVLYFSLIVSVPYSPAFFSAFFPALLLLLHLFWTWLSAPVFKASFLCAPFSLSTRQSQRQFVTHFRNEAKQQIHDTHRHTHTHRYITGRHTTGGEDRGKRYTPHGQWNQSSASGSGLSRWWLLEQWKRETDSRTVGHKDSGTSLVYASHKTVSNCQKKLNENQQNKTKNRKRNRNRETTKKMKRNENETSGMEKKRKGHCTQTCDSDCVCWTNSGSRPSAVPHLPPLTTMTNWDETDEAAD